jgi:hypothetical protein
MLDAKQFEESIIAHPSNVRAFVSS